MTGETVSTLLGQAGERPVVMTGWIGEHPTDPGDVAHLVLYPAGHGAAAKMRALAEAMGLVRGDTAALPDLDPAAVSVSIGRDARDVWASLRVDGALVVERPVTAELAEVAESRRWVVFTVGQDPWDGRPGTLDRWLGRVQRLHLGRVPVVAS